VGVGSHGLEMGRLVVIHGFRCISIKERTADVVLVERIDFCPHINEFPVVAFFLQITLWSSFMLSVKNPAFKQLK
jgi:hypothetical protein